MRVRKKTPSKTRKNSRVMRSKQSRRRIDKKMYRGWREVILCAVFICLSLENEAFLKPPVQLPRGASSALSSFPCCLLRPSLGTRWSFHLFFRKLACYARASQSTDSSKSKRGRVSAFCSSLPNNKGHFLRAISLRSYSRLLGTLSGQGRIQFTPERLLKLHDNAPLSEPYLTYTLQSWCQVVPIEERTVLGTEHHGRKRFCFAN